ncbi:esterase-like activity of phytase family protein [Sphingomonas panni]|uniref:esterase-like activity of phytase family protein n=1 Tax=Sphingomonas panni TaxID=237612 RepID=UPI001F5BBE87|nr:esterase-like activity of phytase family protein [Sphingomonas panni]
MRILLVCLAVLLLLPSWSGSERLPLYRAAPQVDAAPVDLYPADPRRMRNGALTYLGGVSLTASDPAFGGFSAIHVAGDRFMLLSDGGGLLRFRMGRDWRVRDTRVTELAGPGTGWEKRDRDTESLAVLPGGDMLVGYERDNQIWRFDRDLRPVRHAAPRAMRRWSENGGPEAMAAMPDGSVVVLSEAHGRKGRQGYSALRFSGDPTAPGIRPMPFRYQAPADYRVTDAVALPDGRLLVLTRSISLRDYFTARLQIADMRGLRPGQLVTGRTIARFEPPALHDNFEGLALVREGDRLILWVVSDDNQSITQRTLLLKFALPLRL